MDPVLIAQLLIQGVAMPIIKLLIQKAESGSRVTSADWDTLEIRINALPGRLAPERPA